MKKLVKDGQVKKIRHAGAEGLKINFCQRICQRPLIEFNRLKYHSLDFRDIAWVCSQVTGLNKHKVTCPLSCDLVTIEEVY